MNVQCIGCNKKTNNPKFCSRSCAAKTNNRLYPKREKLQRQIIQKEHKCIRHDCQNIVKLRIKTCAKCLGKDRIMAYGNRLLNEFTSNHARHKYQKVRNHAHNMAEIFELKKICKVCNYKIYVELCHKKAIGTFSKDTPIKIVNSFENLVFLCPNHHKELDLGLLSI